MKANELRIGNFINNNGNNIEVEMLDSTYIGHKQIDDSIGCILSQCSGIPLTEEWLLKFGGKKTDMGILIKLQRGNVMSLNVLLKSCIVSISGAFGLVTPCHIKYVHQLQNLYFALTEKELTT